jgi:hypothetical protein
VVTTVLTSFDENAIRCEYGRRSDEVVSEHARAANLAGAQALLCSPQELRIIHLYSHVERLTKIVNGIRFRDAPLKRTTCSGWCRRGRPSAPERTTPRRPAQVSRRPRRNAARRWTASREIEAALSPA